MRTFRDIPIKHKLVIIIMLTTTAALLLAGSVLWPLTPSCSANIWSATCRRYRRILADNSTAALAFNDPKTATETLAALRARPHLVRACIYRPDGTMLASYSRPDAPSTCPPMRVQDELQFGSNDLSVSRADYSERAPRSER